MELGFYALLLALSAAFPPARRRLRQNSFLDFPIMSVSTVGVTVPNFVVGPVLTLVFAITLPGCRPVAGATARCAS